MKKKLIIIFLLTILLCVYSENAADGFGGEGAFGSIVSYLKRVATHIIPSKTNTYDLGSLTKKWRNAHVGGTLYVDDISGVDLGQWTDGGDVLYPAEIEDNVGIGTTAPAYKLQVIGDVGVNGDVYVTEDVFTEIDFGVGGNLGVGITAPIFRLDVRGVGDVIFDNTGNVGIGTTNPSEKLDIVGDIAVSGTVDGIDIAGRDHNAVTVTDTTTINLTLSTQAIQADSLLTAGDHLTLTAADFDVDDDFLLNTGDIGSGTYSFTGSIGTLGNVGIGTTNPTDLLDVNNLFVVESGGSVGIGTTSPGMPLHIDTTSNKGLRIETNDSSRLDLYSDNAGTRNWMFLTNVLEGGDFQLRNSDAARGDPLSAGTTRLHIKTNGNVGIGTTSPDELLHVSGGNIALEPAQKLIFDKGSGDNSYIWEGANRIIRVVSGGVQSAEIKGGETNFPANVNLVGNLAVNTNVLFANGSSGNVGIGTTGPTTKLEVIGGIASRATTVTVANAATTFAVTSNVVTVTGDGGGNTVATITGGVSGQVLTLIFVDALVVVTDTDAHTANTADLSAAFTSADDTTLTLVSDGTSWYEVSRSVN